MNHRAAWVFGEYGSPKQVLRLLRKYPLRPQSSNWSAGHNSGGGDSSKLLTVRVLAAPINPSDVNQIEGIYPARPAQLPAVGGNEAVCEVLDAPSDSPLQPGQWCITRSTALGTWSTHLQCRVEDMIAVDKRLPLLSAATMGVNLFSAYRMLHDFIIPSRPSALSSSKSIAASSNGERNGMFTLIQNGANSGVGRAVIQLAKALGGGTVNTINIIRERSDNPEATLRLKQELLELGADKVFTDRELQTSAVRELLAELNKGPNPIRLALNCVGGRSAVELSRQLCDEGVMVTYGNMSKQSVSLPTGLLIFRNISCTGFWMAKWKDKQAALGQRGEEAYREMVETLSKLILDGRLLPPPCDLVPMFTGGTVEEDTEAFMKAFDQSQQSFYSRKQVLVMQ